VGIFIGLNRKEGGYGRHKEDGSEEGKEKPFIEPPDISD
jgi:hypothetical protein